MSAEGFQLKQAHNHNHIPLVEFTSMFLIIKTHINAL